jgi:hypothetical protein
LPLSVVQDALTRLGFYRVDTPDAIQFIEDTHRASVRLPLLTEDEDVIPPYLNAIQTTVVGRGVADTETFNALLRNLSTALPQDGTSLKLATTSHGDLSTIGKV